MNTSFPSEIADQAEALLRSVAAGAVDARALAALRHVLLAQPLRDHARTTRWTRNLAWQIAQKASDRPQGLWDRLRPRVDPVAWLLDQTPDLAWVLIHDPNGWHREAALRRLQAPQTALDLLALLVRVSDWVPEVSLLAEDRLAEFAASIPPAIVAEVTIAHLPRIEGFWRLSNRGRTLWAGLLAREDVRTRLVAGFITGQGGLFRRTFLRLMQDSVFDPDLPRLAHEAAHPSVRAAALWWQMAGVVTFLGPPFGRMPSVSIRRPLTITPDPGTLMTRAVGDRSALVRKTAAEMLRLYSRTDAEAAQALAQRLAQDRNRIVRERAEWFLSHR